MKFRGHLSDRQEPVYRLLYAFCGRDVPIEDIYVEFNSTDDNKYTRRRMQQRLGPVIARINDKLDGWKIVPGKLKGTYRLTRKGNASE